MFPQWMGGDNEFQAAWESIYLSNRDLPVLKMTIYKIYCCTCPCREVCSMDLILDDNARPARLNGQPNYLQIAAG